MKHGSVGSVCLCLLLYRCVVWECVRPLEISSGAVNSIKREAVLSHPPQRAMLLPLFVIKLTESLTVARGAQRLPLVIQFGKKKMNYKDKSRSLRYHQVVHQEWLHVARAV